jgi:hypothetical protein
MRIVRFITVTALVIISLLAGIGAALRLVRLHPAPSVGLPTLAVTSADSRLTYSSQQTGDSTTSFRAVGQQGNVLELPKASLDFVGYWGGSVHSSIQRLSPDLVGTSPQRVSVIFGRQGDTVFMTSELYASPKQKIVRRPKVRIVSSRLTIIEYESADKELYYVCRDSFRLNDASSISYEGSINIYDLNSHRMMGVVAQTALLKRLLSTREQLEFARPGRGEIPRARVAASEHLGSH